MLAIWRSCKVTFVDLWPLNHWSYEEVTVDNFASLSKNNMLMQLEFRFGDVANLTFVDLWPLNHWSYGEVTVDNFSSLSKNNMMMQLEFRFGDVANLTFVDLWPLNHWSYEEVTMNTFVSLSMNNTMTFIELNFNDVWNLTFFGKIDHLTPLMTFDPDEKNTHIHRQNALLQFKFKNSTMLGSGNKNSWSF